MSQERFHMMNEVYGRFNEDERLSRSRQGQLEYWITMHYIQEYLKRGDRILDIGAGTGQYSIALGRDGYELVAVELVQSNLDTLRHNARDLDNVSAFQGDALDLSSFPDESFNLTLLFGPMYHLYTDEDHHKAIDEALRVTKRNGVILVAFLSAHAIVYTNYLYDWSDTKAGIERNFDEQYQTRHFEAQVFTGFDVHEFERLFDGKGVEHLKTVATDSILEIAEGRPDFVLTDEAFEAFAHYHLAVCEKRELLGASSHLLYIGMKL